ncbi:suppressor of cytokine signaling 3-like [Alligator mississippiensis]|uniref:Suppressor of cytokine signaling 3-like n=2 Tax=Alligator mississippiensis TaxID=8496 RepID=A0A151P609_ALLMI|nr:suppressor of cytokine signaling 3-like [Alligator mississippiensis]
MNGPPGPAPPNSYHYKSFCGDFERVETVLERLEASGFYWGSLSGTEAKRLLSPHPPGAFLVRDSSDHRHLFTLSLRTGTGITNLRIQQRGTAFHLETLPGAPPPPAFACVVQLVEHYLAQGRHGGPCYLEAQGGAPVPLALARPLRCKVPSLQELCRRAVRASVRAGSGEHDLEGLPVPRALRNSLLHS